MNRDIFFAFLLAAGAVLFTTWWLFGFNIRDVFYGEEITILVKDGYYQPAEIEVSVEQSIKLRFIRQDLSACARTVTFPQLNLTYVLPYEKPVVITLPPLLRGEYEFSCPMGIIKGKIIAR